MNDQDATWKIVRTEPELVAILNPAQKANVGLKKLVDDTDATCASRCEDAALRLVRRGRPVALLLTSSHQLLQLRIPAVGRVFESWQQGEQICFKVTGWQQPFTIPASSQFTPLLGAALTERTEIVVVGPQFDGRAAHVEQWKGVARLTGCDDEFRVDLKGLSRLDADQACELYRDIFAQDSTCPFEEGLPFRYSPSGCDYIAEAVARFAAQQNRVVGKVWAFAKSRRTFRVRTSSRRSCWESWWFHVAVVTAKKGGGLWVFDPKLRLERGVTMFGDWKASFGANLGAVHFTTTDAYMLGCDQSDCSIDHPCFLDGEDFDLETDLSAARCMLGCLCDIEGEGDCPPYDFCGFPDRVPDCSKVKI
jgi:hypothetical protein